MFHNRSEEQVLQSLARWAEARDPVRALVLYSSRTNPTAVVDLFSDYDVILALTDILPYWEDRTWLEDFGNVLVIYRNPILPDDQFVLDSTLLIVQYEDGTKIDFALLPIELLRAMLAAPDLPIELDTGYRVLLDKDGLTTGIKPPTFQAHIPSPPTERVYQDLVEEFFQDSTYVAKHLWREDLVPAKSMLEHNLKQDYLRRMLEWQIEIEHGWSVRPGAHGRDLKRWLDPVLWAELEATYCGAGYEENFEALFQTITLFSKVSIEVGKTLGFTYPFELDRRMIAYLNRVKDLPKTATSLRH